MHQAFHHFEKSNILRLEKFWNWRIREIENPGVMNLVFGEIWNPEDPRFHGTDLKLFCKFQKFRKHFRDFFKFFWRENSKITIFCTFVIDIFPQSICVLMTKIDGTPGSQPARRGFLFRLRRWMYVCAVATRSAARYLQRRLRFNFDLRIALLLLLHQKDEESHTSLEPRRRPFVKMMVCWHFAAAAAATVELHCHFGRFGKSKSKRVSILSSDYKGNLKPEIFLKLRF